MAFLDQLKDTAVSLAQTGVAKSKQLAEIAKLKTANLGEEDSIKKAYIEIGKLYYAEHSNAPEGAYVALCEKITAANAAIAANNEKIAELKASDVAAEADYEVEPEDAQVSDLDQVMDEIKDTVSDQSGEDQNGEQ